MSSSSVEIATEFSDRFGAHDSVIEGGVIKAEQSFNTALYLSLLTDARADDDETVPTGSNSFRARNRRGWWGNAFLLGLGAGEYGSRLWLYKRSKLTARVLEELKVACEEALQWLIDTGVAVAVDVEVSVRFAGRVDILITITRNSETPVQYSFVWDALEGFTNGNR
jgi:phage gp46-like protein